MLGTRSREQLVLSDASLPPFPLCPFWWSSALPRPISAHNIKRKITWDKENDILGGQQDRAAQQKSQHLHFKDEAVNKFTERKLSYKSTERWDKLYRLEE